MLENFDENYEVCNCNKVTLKTIIMAIKGGKVKTLGDMQEITRAGTDCRHCIFEEGDFGKVKKKLYCKDILNEFKKSSLNG